MRALEDLLNEVRDGQSRERLGEAVRAYQGGALRAAIISTWVAVALDLVNKVRELAELGEPVAQAYVSTVDRAIAARDYRKLAILERELLDRCRDDFELIGGREHTELTRLLDDRHVCAHPAFVSPDVVFDPTPELCRLHLGTAVDTVLKHGPTPGRKALDRFITEAHGTSWPGTRAALADHLRARYVEQGKEVLRRNLAVVIVKGCLDEDDEPFAQRLAEAAHALEMIAPTLLDRAFDDVVARRERTSGLTDKHLLNFTGRLGDLGGAWRALPHTSHARVVAALRAAPVAELQRVRAFSVEVPQLDVAAVLTARLGSLDATVLPDVIATQPGPALVPHAIASLQDAGSWRMGEARMRELILPLAQHLDLAQLRRVHDVLRTNDQVRMAAAVPSMVTTLFTKTMHVPGALQAWKEISVWLRAQGRDGDPDDWYAYPQLACQVAEAEGGLQP